VQKIGKRKKLSLRICRIIIEERHKLYYYRGLREFENERGCLTDTCLFAKDVYKALLEYFQENSEFYN